MKILLLSVAIVLAVLSAIEDTHAQATRRLRVLFIGNSYTEYNNLPGLVAQVAASAGDTVTYGASTIGGYNLQQHFNTASTLALIRQGNWDRVVLQEHSRIPSWGLPLVQTQFFKYGRLLDSTIKAHNPQARTFLYITWGRRDGDIAYCPDMPWVCTYWDMDSTLRLRYEMLADMEGAALAPVGPVRRRLRRTFPSLDLYIADGTHPSPVASYVAACTMYTTLFAKSLEAVTFTAGHPAAVVDSIHKAVTIVAYDSLAYWRVFGRTAVKPAWVRRATGPNYDRYNKVAFDRAGNSYSAGSFVGMTSVDAGQPENSEAVNSTAQTDTARQLLLTKYSRSGAFQWSMTAQSSGAGAEAEAWDVALHADSLFVVGYFKGTLTLASLPGVGGTSATLASAGGKDIFLAKYAPNGRLLWALRSGGSSDDEAWDVNVSRTGKAYIAGNFSNTITFSGRPGIAGGIAPVSKTSAGKQDAFILKFTNTGALDWVVTMGGLGNDICYTLQQSPEQDIFVGGSFEQAAVMTPISGGTWTLNSAGSTDGFVGQLGYGGTVRWLRRFGGTGADNCRSVAVDNSGNPAYTGFFTGQADFNQASGGPGASPLLQSAGATDGYALSLTRDGSFRWARRFGGAGADEGRAAVSDRVGNIFLTGFFRGTADDGQGRRLTSTNGSQDILLWRLSSLGKTDHLSLAGGSFEDQGRGLDTTEGGGAMVAGQYGNNARFGDLGPYAEQGNFGGFVARFEPALPNAGLAAPRIFSPARAKAEFGLAVWPVPFRSELTVQTDLPVQVLDVQGRIMAQAEPDAHGRATLRLAYLPRGLYLVRSRDGRVAKVVKE